jgi:hypothetical protein
MPDAEMVACLDVANLPYGDSLNASEERRADTTTWEIDVMRMHPTLILSGMATGAVAAAIALAPNASAEPSAPTCNLAGQAQNVCQSPGNFQGDFSHPVEQPSTFEFPWLQGN